jgi:uncharacterized DUF497 family protein
MAFIWDPEKAEKNFRDHGVYFEDAEYVFDDPRRIKRRDSQAALAASTIHSLQNKAAGLDDDSSGSEERYQTIGTAKKVIFVVYTEEGDDDTRLITARVADPKERRIYHGFSETYPYGWERA